MGFPLAQTVKNLTLRQETGVRSLGCEDPPEDEMATHSSFPVWEIPRTEEPDGLQSTGSQRVRVSWWLSQKESTSKAGDCLQRRRHGFDPWVRKIPWRRKWQPTPVFLFGKSHRQRSLVDYSPWGCKRVGQDSETKQQQQI